MDYRSHYPGTFEQHLDLLEESVHSQKEWLNDVKALCIGIAVNYLFKEEPNGPYSWEKLSRAILRIASTGVPGIVVFCDDQLEMYGMREAVGKEFG